MKLDYGILLSNEPIRTKIATIKPPRLITIRKTIGFDVFSLYEMYLRITPKIYYNLIVPDGSAIWKSISKEERSTIEMYDLVLNTKELQSIYEEIFNFFIIENVIFIEKYFVVLNKQDIDHDEITVEDVKGIICKENFKEILSLLQQICGFEVKEEESLNKEQKFKNDRAKELYEKIYGKNDNDSDDDLEKKEVNYDLTLPNIISAVSNCHPTISPLNVWNLTVFQLVDSFHRIMQNKADSISRTNVAVWGDEENKFKDDQWLKNRYDITEDYL